MYQDRSSALLRGASGRRGSDAIPVGRLAHHSTAAGPHRRPSVTFRLPEGSQSPLATAAAGLPQGRMLAADRGHEAMLLELACELEDAQPWPAPA